MTHFKHHYIRKSIVLTVTYLTVLVVLKIKILSGYQFLWHRSFLVTKNIIPESIGYLNPFFYFDDIFVALLFFLLSSLIFKKSNRYLNIFLYVTYFLISFYSILDAIILYKYGVPLNPHIIYQIDSLYTMRTSIDTEVHENYRLIATSTFILTYSIVFPILLTYIINFISKYKTLQFSYKLRSRWLIFLVFSILLSFTIKNAYFRNDILTESPLTTLFKSSTKFIYNNTITANRQNYDFDDQITPNIFQKHVLKSDVLGKYRKKYNVILIVLETTNAQIYHPSSSFSNYLPNLSRLAKEGIYLSNFFTPFPRSSKAFFAILTSHYPLTDYRSLLKIAPNLNVPDIFSILKKNNYNTFAGYSGDFNYDRMADFLAGRGVDRLVDFDENDGDYSQVSWGADDELIYNKLMDWIDSLENCHPFFALLLPINSHHPFWTPKRDHEVVPGDDEQNRYINAIHYQDYLIGCLIDFLDTTNRLKNTIIMITGDHGAVFNSLESETTKASPYSLDINSIKVPFYLYFDGVHSTELDHNILASHIDILPTTLDLLGIKCDEQFQGRSLFDSKAMSRVIFVYHDYYHQLIAALTNDWDLLRDMTDSTTILSHNLHFKTDSCPDETQVCSLLLGKVKEFVEFQNRRLFLLSRKSLLY